RGGGPGLSGVRGAASIGGGLEPGRVARPIRRDERIHVVGAAGAGASAAALLAHRSGALVSGCDSGGPSPYTPPLVAAGIELAWSHDPRHVTAGARPDRLAVTKALTAVDPHNAELEAARAASVPLEPWQQVVADAAVGKLLVGVAGTHGKSTCSGWLLHVLVSAGLDPSGFVGALLPADLSGGHAATARWGNGEAFVVEADEYAGNFDPYRPAVAILTSAEWDHPDVFADREAVVACFTSWLERAVESVPSPLLVANVADPGVAAVAGRLNGWPGRVLATALAGESGRFLDVSDRDDLRARFATGGGPADLLEGRIAEAGPEGTTLQIRAAGISVDSFTVRLRLPGRHNSANALGVAGAALSMGVSGEMVAAGLAGFRGVGRRLERKGEGRGVVVYDDYGHHPTAIRATLAALRQIEPGRRIWAVYEPLTYHRTAAMLEQFAEVLATADCVAIADIWAGRDPDTSVASAAALAQAVARQRPGVVAVAPGSVEATSAWLAREVRPGDAVLVMGGGKSYRIAELLVQALRG
ncbi:MAG: UDP-N-acetylmuramate--L-alanine ligase, partial [Candidatus Limnocylindrales bacterium]